jgi:hypothetical protein
MAVGEHAYLSIVAWPRGYTREMMTESLVEATGMDPFHADQRIARGVPTVVERIDAAVAREVLRPLRKRKVAAFAPTQSQMDAVAAPLSAKRLVPAGGAPQPMYLCEPWRGEGIGFLASDLFLLVRAGLQRERGQVETDVTYGGDPDTGGGLEVHTWRHDKMRLSEAMDLYLRDGSRIRISGDKFSFDVLGTERGHSDNENMDRLALRLAEESPNVLVDVAFRDFVCPPHLISGWRRQIGARSVRDDQPAFEFYSVWSFLLHKRLARRES